MFFFKPKEYICCEKLKNGLHIDYPGLYYCCCFSSSNKNYIPVVKLSDDIKSAAKQFEQIRKKDLKLIRNGIIPERCKGCSYLKSDFWDPKDDKIKFLSFTANKKCNSDCIYCTTHRNKKYCNSLPDIKIYDYLKSLITKNKIDKNCEIHIGGGELALLEEFPQIMDLFLENLTSKMKIYSSAIKYSPEIEKALRLKRCLLCVSLDCGNPELYKKIKNVDEYNSVVNNLEKYCSLVEDFERIYYVELKYIIIPDVNDKEEYILEFLQVAKKISCYAVRCEIDWNWVKQNKNNLPKIKNLFKIMKYMELKSKEMGLSFCFLLEPKLLIERYNEEYNSTVVEIQ